MENLSAGYGDKVILEKIKTQPGAGLAHPGLLGRNGAGKSTFIKMLSGGKPAAVGQAGGERRE